MARETKSIFCKQRKIGNNEVKNNAHM